MTKERSFNDWNLKMTRHQEATRCADVAKARAKWTEERANEAWETYSALKDSE